MLKIPALPSPIKKQLPLILTLLALLLLVISGWFWWSKVFTSPERVFEDMLSNSLSLSSVTRRVAQSSEQGGQDEVAQLVFGGQNGVHVKSAVEQPDQSGQTNKVVTESIGTLNDDFARYLIVQTTQKDKSGKALDFSKIQNVWAKSDAPQSGQLTNARYFRQSLQGIVLFGNLSPSARASLVNQLIRDEVYKTDYGKIERVSQNGRQRYIYEVVIQPDKYVAALNAYNKAVGLGGSEDLNPETYKNASPVTIKLTVDVLSRQLVQVAYANDEQTGRRETYSGHNGQYRLDIPEQTISFTELQQRVESVQ